MQMSCDLVQLSLQAWHCSARSPICIHRPQQVAAAEPCAAKLTAVLPAVVSGVASLTEDLVINVMKFFGHYP